MYIIKILHVYWTYIQKEKISKNLAFEKRKYRLSNTMKPILFQGLQS